MELRHLRYFLAVGEALSFTKAAAQLRVAQPALTGKCRTWRMKSVWTCSSAAGAA